MHFLDARRLRQMPYWGRVCLTSFLILGIFAMHNALTSDHGAMGAHHGTTSMADTGGGAQNAAEPVHATTTHPQLMAVDDGSLSISDCGGLMMLCIAMSIGTGGLIALRKAALDRILWQLPPPQIFALGSVLAPLQNRSPLQRTAVLRV